MNLAPIVFIGFIIFFLTMSARVRKQAEEARRANQRREELRQNAEASAKDSPRPAPAAPRVQTTAAPRVQTPPAARAKASAAPARPAPQKKQEPKPRAEARPTVKADAAPSAATKAEKPETRNTQTSGEAKNPVIRWNQDSALQGIILAEILGKPKALRK